MPQCLADAERQRLPELLPAWRVLPDRDALARDWRFDWRFPGFSAAWGCMARVALLAGRQDRHPEWSNIYGRVFIVLTTHDAGGLSERDVRLARVIDALG